jgi:uncharacterized membrane protein
MEHFGSVEAMIAFTNIALVVSTLISVGIVVWSVIREDHRHEEAMAEQHDRSIHQHEVVEERAAEHDVNSDDENFVVKGD